MTITTEEYVRAQAAEGQWAAHMLARLLPALVEKGLISESALQVALGDLVGAQGLLTDEGKEVTHVVRDLLNAPYGNGHFG